MHFSGSQKIKLLVLPRIGHLFLTSLCSTLRYQVEGWEGFQQYKDCGRTLILCFWHNQILYATHFFRDRGIVVMSSDHFDGHLTSRVISHLGYSVARGSSTRGGARAILELKRHLENGRDVGFTADGPKGPVYRAKPGPIWLSQKTAAPILPFHLEPERYWQMRSWDGFRIPKPFSRCLVKIAPGFIVPPGTTDDEWLPVYQGELDRLKEYSEKYWG
jgi:lysophospholipid acyltransferase (LPLAT)-like uncharacterized protein